MVAVASLVLLFAFIAFMNLMHHESGFCNAAERIIDDIGDNYGLGGGGDDYGLGAMNPYADDPHNPHTTEPDAEMFETEDELQLILNRDDTEPVVVGYFDLETNLLDKDLFDQIADQDGKVYTFAYTTNKDVLAKNKVEGSAVYVYKPSKYISAKSNEKQKSRFGSNSLTKEQLRSFIHTKALPMVGEKTFKSNERYEKVKVPVLTAFTDVDMKKNPKGFDYLSNRLRKVAEEYKGRVVFNIGDKNTFNHVLKMYGLSHLPEKKDIGIGLYFEHTYYHMDESKGFSVEIVKEFLSQYFDGKLKGRQDEDIYAKPPSPSSQGDKFSDAVVQLTKDSFASEITNNKNDYFLDFHAPWCGHCKSLKPHLNEVADSLKSDDSITIAAYDATAHTAPSGFEVKGFPTIYFIPAKSSGKKPIVYSGNRDASSMKDFINKHRTTARI